jgi:thiamine pyrophosphate-dependent acetolactate synthase large subunit-like protein
MGMVSLAFSSSGASTMPYLNGAQAAIATLRAHNIDTIFGIPGAHTLLLYDAIRNEPGLRHVLARHEQAAGFMADGYARITGQPGTVCTITGPGVTNVATPVANAYADSIPLLVISSSIPRASKGSSHGELHEVKNQFGVMEALAGWSRAVTLVEEIPDAIRDALRLLRSGRPRSAYVEIPYDLLGIEADVAIPGPTRTLPVPPLEEAIIATASLLREAQRPLIVAGNGVTAAGANKQLALLAEMLQAPVLLGSKSHDVVPSSHPLAITSTGYDLVPELISLVSSSDVALVVGSKLGAERTGERRLPLPHTIAQIDIDPAEIGHTYPVAIGIVADAHLAIDALLEVLNDLPHDLPSRIPVIAEARAALQAYTQRTLGSSVAFLDALSESIPHDGVVVADMTMLGYASARYLPVYEPRSFIHPVEFCAIGCGLPLALGAKVAAPERPVVALCGDGGFLLNVGELATAVQEKLDGVIVVFDDGAYTAVKKVQHKQLASRYIATDLVGPDYVTLARAFGIKGVQARSPDELRDAVRTAVRHNGPTLIEVPLPPWQW